MGTKKENLANNASSINIKNALSENFSFAEVTKNVKSVISKYVSTERGKSVYKKEILEEIGQTKYSKISDAHKKNSRIRSYLRKFLQNNFVEPYMKSGDTDILKEFLKYYSAVYIVNDFSVSSVSSSNDEEKRTDLEKFLSAAKKLSKK